MTHVRVDVGVDVVALVGRALTGRIMTLTPTTGPITLQGGAS